MLDLEYLLAPHYSVEDFGEATVDLGGIGEKIGTAVHTTEGNQQDENKSEDESVVKNTM